MRTPQNKQQVVGDYRLEVTDFGPIVRASVDLRPLTVFIGPSNTGKSYLAILIYALQRFFNGTVFDALFGRVAGPTSLYQFLSAGIEPSELSEEDTENLFDWIDQTIKKAGAKEFPKNFHTALPESIAALIRPLLGDAGPLFHGPREDLLDSEIEHCFGVNATRQLIRHRSKASAKVILRHFVSDTPVRSEPFEYEFTLKGESPTLNSSIPPTIPLQLEVNENLLTKLKRAVSFLTLEEDITRATAIQSATDGLLEAVVPYVVGPLARRAYYLPADRTGVMHIHQVVASTLVQGATTARLRPSDDGPLLSGVLADFLSQLIEMGSEQVLARQNLSYLTERLEKNILGGAVRLETETGYPRFAYRPDGWKFDLPLTRASSMVSELVPVVLYLRYLVRPGDVLIIEEPEAHLHPAMQAVFARELARLTHSGIRVVVTTHSEWLLDQFANLVRLSTLPKDERKGIPGADVALWPKQFGAWLFKPKQRPKGSVVEEIKVDPEAGGLLTDYGDIAEQLYNEWAEIGNRITESGG